MTTTETKQQQEQIQLFGQAYRNFADSIHSPATKGSYDFALCRYMKHLNVRTVDDLLKDADKPKLIEAQIIEYIVSLRNPPNSLRYQTLNVYLSSVVTFYAMNDVSLNRKKVARYLGEPTMTHRDRAYTTEEIAKLLQFCDQRSKAIVLFLASTGARLGSLSLFRLGHLSLVPEYDLYQVTIYANTKDEYFTFTTPEAKRAIEEYLQYRERCEEKLTKDTPLFRQQFDGSDSLAVAYPKPLKLRSIENLMDDTLVRAGLKTITRQIANDPHNKSRNRKEVARLNGFRKFAITQMAKARVDPEVREKLVGHSIGIPKHYIRYSPQEMLQEYLKAVDLLTINEENRLKLKVDELQSKQSEIELMKIDMKKQEEMIQSFADDCSNSYAQDRILEDQKMEIADLRKQLNEVCDFVRSKAGVLGMDIAPKKEVTKQ